MKLRNFFVFVLLKQADRALKNLYIYMYVCIYTVRIFNRIQQPKCHYMSMVLKSLKALFPSSSTLTLAISVHIQQLLWVLEVTVTMNTC